MGVTDEGIADARARLGPGGRAAWYNLRVLRHVGPRLRRHERQRLSGHSGRPTRPRLFVAGAAPHLERARRDWMKSDEGFFRHRRSGRADFPRTQPSPDAHLEWMTVTSDAAPPCVAPYRSRYSGPEPRLPVRGGRLHGRVARGSATPTPYHNHIVRHSVPGACGTTERSDTTRRARRALVAD